MRKGGGGVTASPQHHSPPRRAPLYPRMIQAMSFRPSTWNSCNTLSSPLRTLVRIPGLVEGTRDPFPNYPACGCRTRLDCREYALLRVPGEVASTGPAAVQELDPSSTTVVAIESDFGAGAVLAVMAALQSVNAGVRGRSMVTSTGIRLRSCKIGPWIFGAIGSWIPRSGVAAAVGRARGLRVPLQSRVLPTHSRVW